MEQVDTGSSRTPLFSGGLDARTRAASVEVDGARIAYWVYEPVRVTPEATSPELRDELVVTGEQLVRGR